MRSLGVTLGLLALSAATMLLYSRGRDTRSVGPPAGIATLMAAAPKFSPDEAAGLFVGVSTFAHDRSLTVPYAVDDAVDLAHNFALNQRIGLVPPRRVVLAISGQPRKEASKARLQELKDAGARVEGATAGDILQLLKEQAARTGSGGLLVLSIATHGFQQNGDAYILGSTSAFGSTEAALRLSALLDVSAEATRSLIFVDACRDRIGQTSRSATPDPASAAPLIRRMTRVRGQVIFYAAAPGEYAFDDPVQQNGVFTKAVLDGLVECKAPAPRGMVVAQTLHTYVDREVRRWIETNRNRRVNPATQVSMEGETRNMPLSRCWVPVGRELRVAFDGSVITAYGEDTDPLWRQDAGQPIVHAEAADLDADGFKEVVIGLRDRLLVLDRDGERRWERTGDTLRTFTTGDLFEKKTHQIVAVWYDQQAAASRLTIIDSEARELSTFDYAGELRHVAVGRPTKMHAPKIVATSGTTLLLLKVKKNKSGTPLWRHALRSPRDTIRRLKIVDVDHDRRDEIVLTTARGTTWFTFEGKIVQPPR